MSRYLKAVSALNDRGSLLSFDNPPFCMMKSDDVADLNWKD